MPTNILSHDCNYEAVDVPGRPVVPIIGPHEGNMQPGRLYRCRRCDTYAYITQAHQPLWLREVVGPWGQCPAR
jgi:hypothetical protein